MLHRQTYCCTISPVLSSPTPTPDMSRSLARTALELCRSRLPPTYLLPVRARCIVSSSSSLAITPTPPPPIAPSSTLDAPLRHTTTSPSATPPSSLHNQANAAAVAAIAKKGRHLNFTPKNKPPARGPPTEPPPLPTIPIPQAIKDALPLLRAQPGHYITFHIHGKPYLVTPGDMVRLPFHMPGVLPGDVLRLNRASVLGSRDFTIKPGSLTPKPGSKEPAYIDERLYQLRAVVAGVESEPMREMEKTKRRNRKVKTVKTKLKYTVLRISELKIADPKDL